MEYRNAGGVRQNPKDVGDMHCLGPLQEGAEDGGDFVFVDVPDLAGRAGFYGHI